MVKMRMFGFMQQQHQQHQQQAPPKPAPASSGGSGKLFDMKNLGAIMKVKSTGCKSCGG
jgi:hypothetical protein